MDRRLFHGGGSRSPSDGVATGPLTSSFPAPGGRTSGPRRGPLTGIPLSFSGPWGRTLNNTDSPGVIAIDISRASEQFELLPRRLTLYLLPLGRIEIRGAV